MSETQLETIKQDAEVTISFSVFENMLNLINRLKDENKVLKKQCKS